MGVGYCLTLRIVSEFARFLCTADKALEQRLSFNMFVAWSFNFATGQKYEKFGISKKKNLFLRSNIDLIAKIKRFPIFSPKNAPFLFDFCVFPKFAVT